MPPSTTSVWQSAASLAARAHDGQLRKDERTPYIAHTVRVAMTIVCVFGVDDPIVLAAALLHDVIEDCNVSYDKVVEACGRPVADLVACLSKDMRLSEPQREDAYDVQLAAGPWQARLIKLADVFDNLSDPHGHDRPQRMLTRAERALNLARNDPELADACRMVEGVVERARGGSR